jgi:chromosome segregation ATPase
MRAYESKYREYSDLAVKAKVQLQAVNKQFNSLNSRYRVKTFEVVDMDKQLQGLKSELKDRQSPIAVQAEQEQVDIN